MHQQLKNRLIGATVITALAVIFVPMAFEDRDASTPPSGTVDLKIPPPPPEANPQGGADAAPFDVPPPPPPDAPQSAVTGEEDFEVISSSEDLEPAATEPVTPPSPPPRPRTPPIAATEPPPPPKPTEPAKPEKTEKPAQQPAAGSWVVQLGSFTEERNAQSLRDRLRKANIPAFVQESGGGKGRFRVLVGPEKDRRRADATRKQILARFKIDGFVTGYPN